MLLTRETDALSAQASPTATCVQNSRIILGKYLNVKLTAHIIRADSSQAGGVARVRREERLVSLVYLVWLVELD